MAGVIKIRVMRIACLLILVSVILGGTLLNGQGDPNIFVNIASKQDKAAESKFGKEYHEHLKDMLENRMFNGIKTAYPCIHYLDRSAVEKMIGVERMRELLGGEGGSRLGAIGNAIGASHIGWANVTVMGGTVVIDGAMMNSATAKAVGRAQVTVAAGNDNAIEAAMGQFVSKLVASAGGEGPKCGGWQGEISAASSQHEKGKNPSGDPFTTDTDLKITCQISPNNSEPACQVSYSYSMAGKDSTITNAAGGPARCIASASIYNGSGHVRVGPCQVQGSYSVTVAGFSATDKPVLSLGGWEVEFPAARDTKQFSGAKQPDKYTTVNWSLTYK